MSPAAAPSVGGSLQMRVQSIAKPPWPLSGTALVAAGPCDHVRCGQSPMGDTVTRVAIVEDHKLVLDALTRELGELSGTEVVWSGSDPDALLADWPGVDVLLLDLDLGERSATPKLVHTCIERGSRVLVVSALADPALVRRLATAGISGIVSKAESIAVLLEAVQCVAGGSDWMSPQLVAAIANSAEIDFPSLSDQEQRVMLLYASGLKIATVARRLEISPHTVKDYLRRIRAKYLAVGRPAPTQTDLYREAVRSGLIED